jgi:hypothetical protein
MLLIGLAGWLSTREKKIATKATWESKVDTKLDFINSGINGVCTDIKTINQKLSDHDTTLAEHTVQIEELAKRK